MNLTNISRRYDCITQVRYLTLPLDYSYYICGPIMTVFLITGLIGNVICLVIFLKTRPTPIVNFYTIPLCVCDCAVLISAFVMSNLPHLLYGRMKNYGPYVPIYPFATFCANFAYTFCVWLVVLLSVERYFAICHPLRHKIYDAKRRSVLVSLSCLTTSFLYSIPRYFQFEVFQCYELTKGRLMHFLEEAEFHRSRPYWLAYKVVLSPLLFSVGPLTVLCFLSIRIMHEVKRARMMLILREELAPLDSLDHNRSGLANQVKLDHNRLSLTNQPKRSMSGSENSSVCNQQRSFNEQRRILIFTLLSVVLKFFLFHTLPAIIDICESFMDDDQFDQWYMDYLVDTSILLVVMNSSMNICIFMICNRKFRRQLATLFVKRKKSLGSATICDT